ncbi:unnamed protein product [Rodentolepis nana]|uniref:Transmembrane protein n=1 Tax=Rodentolepis nana TaxID=102285 RepID=A0A0R3TRR6_RODNA|nr:unnamed protein product [Rodentolepis nana]
MKEENELSTGVIVFLAILIAFHVVCWVASVVKAVIDRKASKKTARAVKSEPLLEETRKKEKEEASQQALLSINADDNGEKFAIRKAKTQPNSPTTPTPPNEHYFPKCPKRHLSTDGAKRISPEQLAIMLDNYGTKRAPNLIDPSVIPSPTRLPAKGITTVNM